MGEEVNGASEGGEGGGGEEQSGIVGAGQDSHASPGGYAYDDDEVEVAGYSEETLQALAAADETLAMVRYTQENDKRPHDTARPVKATHL